MNKYVILFSKQGYVRYTSHLDMLRLFERAFKRADIRLAYSQGFNPHPKISFGQPLSLGYTASAEMIEFEMAEPAMTSEIVEKLRPQMPEGIGIEKCTALPDELTKSLASMTVAAEYTITMPVEGMMPDEMPVEEMTERYLAQESIVVLKKTKKHKEGVETDIRKMIRGLTSEVVNNKIFLKTTLDAGSDSNLNPDHIVKTYLKFTGFPVEPEDVMINRDRIVLSRELSI